MASERKLEFGFNLCLFYIFLGAKDGIREQIEILKRKSCCISVHLVSFFSPCAVNLSNVVRLTL